MNLLNLIREFKRIELQISGQSVGERSPKCADFSVPWLDDALARAAGFLEIKIWLLSAASSLEIEKFIPFFWYAGPARASLCFKPFSPARA